MCLIPKFLVLYRPSLAYSCSCIVGSPVSIDLKIKAKGKGVMCKLDMEKAYNHVYWSFLDYMLRSLGFGMACMDEILLWNNILFSINQQVA